MSARNESVQASLQRVLRGMVDTPFPTRKAVDDALVACDEARRFARWGGSAQTDPASLATACDLVERVARLLSVNPKAPAARQSEAYRDAVRAATVHLSGLAADGEVRHVAR